MVEEVQSALMAEEAAVALKMEEVVVELGVHHSRVRVVLRAAEVVLDPKVF